VHERGADVVQHGLRRSGERGHVFRARDVRRLEAAAGTVEVRDRRTVDDRVDPGRQLRVGLLGQPEHRVGDVARHSGHFRPGDRRPMHQAHDVEVTQPPQQSTPHDTRCTSQQNGTPRGARRPANAVRPGNLTRPVIFRSR